MPNSAVAYNSAQKSRELMQNRFRESSSNRNSSQIGSAFDRSGSKVNCSNNESISSNKMPTTNDSSKTNATRTSRAFLPKVLSKKAHEALKNGSVLNESQKNLKDKIEKTEMSSRLSI